VKTIVSENKCRQQVRLAERLLGDNGGRREGVGACEDHDVTLGLVEDDIALAAV